MGMEFKDALDAAMARPMQFVVRRIPPTRHGKWWGLELDGGDWGSVMLYGNALTVGGGAVSAERHALRIRFDAGEMYGPQVSVICNDDPATRSCAAHGERDWPDEVTCRCAEIGDGEQCEACADGEHVACAWGTEINDVGPECRAERLPECWYQSTVNAVGPEALSLASPLVAEWPVALSGNSNDEPIDVHLQSAPDVTPAVVQVRRWPWESREEWAVSATAAGDSWIQTATYRTEAEAREAAARLVASLRLAEVAE